MSNKASIPTVHTDNPALNRALEAIKQNLDALIGRTRTSRRLEPLPPTATLPEVIARLNEISARLQ